VIVGDRVVVKWLTPPVPLPHPTPDLFAHLVEAGFNDTAPPYAALTAELHGRPHLLALVTGYLPDAEDGWSWCVDEAVAGTVTFAPALGRLTADLHLALATFAPSTPDNGQPEGGQPGDGQRSGSERSDRSRPGQPSAGTVSTPAVEFGATRAAARAEDALTQALKLTDGDDGEWLATRAEVMRRELATLDTPSATPLIRIHGDLHVGQILKWRDGYAVIDFDGNPTVSDSDLYQPPARDVAQLTTSLEHVAQVAIKRRSTPPEQAAAWARRAREALLAAYKERLVEKHRPELLDERLIRPFEVEQECRELIYAARHLLRWRYAPMGVLRTWYDPEENIA
jgi:maltokinase